MLMKTKKRGRKPSFTVKTNILGQQTLPASTIKRMKAAANKAGARQNEWLNGAILFALEAGYVPANTTEN